eukprot:1186078-Prorocentrum_minimum.AAC.1
MVMMGAGLFGAVSSRGALNAGRRLSGLTGPSRTRHTRASFTPIQQASPTPHQPYPFITYDTFRPVLADDHHELVGRALTGMSRVMSYAGIPRCEEHNWRNR